MENVNQLVTAWGIIPNQVISIKNNVWKILTDEGNFALKQSGLKEEKLDFIGDSQKQLVAQGFQQFSQPLFYGKSPYLKTDNAFYTLYEWVEGEKCDFDDLTHLSAAGEALAKFHLYSRSDALKEKYFKKVMYFHWTKKLRSRIEDMESYQQLAVKGERRFFEKMYLGVYEPFRSKAVASQNLLLSSAYPRIAKEDCDVGAFIHYDVAARNFVVQGNAAYLIDFDYSTMDMPIVDLMRLIKRSLKYGDNAQAKIDAIVSSYTDIRPLSQEHWEVLYALVLFPQKYWRLGQRYYSQDRQWSEETFNKKMRNAVEELERENLWLPILKERVKLK